MLLVNPYDYCKMCEHRGCGKFPDRVTLDSSKVYYNVSCSKFKEAVKVSEVTDGKFGIKPKETKNKMNAIIDYCNRLGRCYGPEVKCYSCSLRKVCRRVLNSEQEYVPAFEYWHFSNIDVAFDLLHGIGSFSSEDIEVFDKFMNALVHCDTVKVILTGCGEEVYKTKDVYEGISKLNKELESLKARIKEEDLDLHKSDDEIDELNSKYRWRKQSEEPAPTGLLVEEIMPSRIGSSQDYIAIVYSNVERPLYKNSYWRPFEFPGEHS